MNKEQNHSCVLNRGWSVVSVVVGLAGLLTALQAADVPAQAPGVSVIPKPAKMEMGQGAYALDGAAVISVKPGSAEMKAIGMYLADLLAPATGVKLAVKSPWRTKTTGIMLRLDSSLKELGDEGYTLVSTPQGVTINAARPAGVFYGVQTLRQLLPVGVESPQKVEGVAWTVPCVSIEDKPRFRWRGYLIDPARNFRTIAELKRYIDLLAMHKLNMFQLHLTDDQGWRVEIRKYPRLVETGSRLPDYGGRKGEGWSYSQEEIRDLVAYAASRYVTIVPEIEMPGHSGAAVVSYPELGCCGKGGGPLCVSKESTLEYATNVLDEIMALFPSRYVHVGADEVPAGPWRACKSCKPAMEQLAGEKLPDDVTPYRVVLSQRAGLPFHEDIGRLQGEFIRKIDQHIASRGRRMVGWDEILDGGLKNNSTAVVMAWRGATAVGGATGQKRDVIVSLYPDYYLDNGIPLKRTYDYEPVPASLPAGEEKHVIGVQANMWGERTQDIRRVDEQTFPRLSALAEIGWTPREGRGFADFAGRLVPLLRRLELQGVDYKRPAELPAK